jgi:molecular chaperone GrpE
MTEDWRKRRRDEEEQAGDAPDGGDSQDVSSAGDSPGGDPSPGQSVSAEEWGRLVAEKDELTRTMVRRQADFENYRKRVERERQEDARRGASRVMQEMLPVLDGFERALRAHESPAYDEYRKGMELIYRQLWDALAKNGLERIAAQGKQFDPHFHEAIERVETAEHPDGAIVDVVQEGYLFDGRVLRPSLVRVAVDPQGAGGEQPPAAHHRVH